MTLGQEARSFLRRSGCSRPLEGSAENWQHWRWRLALDSREDVMQTEL